MNSLLVSRGARGGLLAAAVAVPLAVAAVYIGRRTNHYPFLNDFWPLLFQADMIDWSRPESFRNGFFPPGYALFLKGVGGRNILANAYYANLIFGLATVLGVFAATMRLASPSGAFVAAVLAAFYPINFSLVMTTGPDTGCAFMLCAAFGLLHLSLCSEQSRIRIASGWTAAALFAISCLWRYHALVFAIAALGSTAVVSRGRVNWRASVGIMVPLALFAMLSLFPGLSPQLARAQAFGVWEAMHPVNWYQMPTDFAPTVSGVISAEPGLFLKAYWQFHRTYLWLGIPPLVGTILLRGTSQRVAVSVLLLELVYLPVVGIGTSLRGFTPVIPLVMVCVGLVVNEISKQLGRALPKPFAVMIPLIVALGAVARPWVAANQAFIESSIAGFDWRRAVEMELRHQGVTVPLQVFGDAGFHFVLNPGPGWYSYLARSNGGWPRLELYRLAEIAPELQTSSLEAFVEDCQRNGITHIVLGATSGGLGPEIGELYAGRRSDPRLVPTAEVAGFKIFRVLRG